MLKKIFQRFCPKFIQKAPWRFMRLNVCPVVIFKIYQENGPWLGLSILSGYLYYELKEWRKTREQIIFNHWVESRQDEPPKGRSRG